MTTAARRPIPTAAATTAADPASRRRFLGLAPAALAAWGAWAGRSEAAASGAQFPAAIVDDFGGKKARLTLTGSALRTVYLLRVYQVASYVQEGVAIAGPEALAALDVPKRLLLVFERDVDGATMAKSFRESIGRGNPAPAFANELTALERYFLANPVKTGDRVALSHLPAKGLGVRVNERPPLLVPSLAFARAAWGTYFGPNHLNMALQDGLTSRIRR